MAHKKNSFALLLFIFFSPFTSVSLAQQPITWTDVVGLSISGDNVTQTASTGWGNAGAASTQRLNYATNGWVETEIIETNTSRMFGLSEINSDANFTSIKYAIYLLSNGTYQVYENGNSTYSSGPSTYQQGDLFRVERIGTSVVYMKNGTIFHTSSVASSQILLVDIALRDTSSTLDQNTISSSFKTPPFSDFSNEQSITWTDLQSVTFVDEKMVSTSSNTWASGAASLEQLDYATDGWVQTIAYETHLSRNIGFSEINENASYASIKYGLHLANNGRVYVYESGTLAYDQVGHIYQSGDTFKVERVGTAINYIHNGSIFYTSNKQSTGKLIIDVALHKEGATLDQITASSSFDTVATPTGQQTVTWTDLENIVFIDQKMISASSNTWFSGAASLEQLDYATDGWVQTIAYETHLSRNFGLSEINENASYASIKYGLHLANNGRVYVYESGTVVYDQVGHIYQSGDTFKVERVGTAINYIHNGSIFYTSNKQSTGKLIIDVALHKEGATLDQITASSTFDTVATPTGQQTITWTDIENIVFIDQKMISTSEDSWVSGAASVEQLDYATDGWVQTIAFETHISRNIGLSEINENASYSSIKYGLHIAGNGRVYVYENGTVVYEQVGHSYQKGDTFRVERVGTSINYVHNDNIFYTSNKQSTSRLIIDVALRSEGTTLDQITASSTFDTVATPIGQQTVTWTDIANIVFINQKMISTSGDPWASGAGSTEQLNQGVDGWVQATVFETLRSKSLGLSEVNLNTNYSSINYGLHLSSNGRVYVYENGTNKYNNTSHYYQQGDVFRVERTGTTISYKQNGTTFYTSTTSSATSLIVDISLSGDGSTLDQISISPSFSTGQNPNPEGLPGLWSQNNNTAYFLNSVAIGRNSEVSDHLLSVQGKIVSQGVKVTLDGWADYVFESDYDLLPLDSLNKFIRLNKHLPDIPSEKEVLSEGVYLEKMDVGLLKNLEQLTLYLIRQHEELKIQKELISQLNKQLAELKEKKN